MRYILYYARDLLIHYSYCSLERLKMRACSSKPLVNGSVLACLLKLSRCTCLVSMIGKLVFCANVKLAFHENNLEFLGVSPLAFNHKLWYKGCFFSFRVCVCVCVCVLSLVPFAGLALLCCSLFGLLRDAAFHHTPKQQSPIL